MQELVPSLYSKKEEKQTPTSEETPEVVVDETVDETVEETTENLEEEIEAIEQRLQSVTDDEEKNSLK